MARITYVNGAYLPHDVAGVHIEDRGFQFADGIYEVVQVANGIIVDLDWHLDRLEYSLNELKIPMPMTRAALIVVMKNIIAKNYLPYGVVYMQVTRGVAKRDFAFPKDTQPSLVVVAMRMKPWADSLIENGVKVITLPDIRWKRCDIKSVSLLAPVLGKQQAKEAGAFEGWMVDENGFITEGTSSNAFIVTKDKEIITRAKDHRILGGITRARLFVIAQEQGLTFIERPFTVAEAKAAEEAFISSSSTFVMPVVRIDDAVVGDGKVGAISKALRKAYREFAGL
jgi:D-alanine transaminase